VNLAEPTHDVPLFERPDDMEFTWPVHGVIDFQVLTKLRKRPVDALWSGL